MEIPIAEFNINKFWERTPTPLKYILIIVIFLATAYFLFTKKLDDNQVKELDQMKTGITATYQLIENFEDFKKEQDDYNKEIIIYLKNLHALVQELNETTNRKFDILLKSGNKNADQIVDKILLLNESFNKISKIYNENIKPLPPENRKYNIIAVPIETREYQNKNKK